ncbi:MAG: hypothetical protein M3N68_09380 [Actinomycetota bacterium]|nr:hypothetical protein [Actinomycetota bacterium]
MSETIRYFVSRAPDGSVSHLVRVRWSDKGLWGDSFRGGRWEEGSTWAKRYLFDPLLGDEISEAEAEKIARELYPTA